MVNVLLIALGIVFLILKLTGTIAWSWWWVVSPFIGVAVVMVVLFLAFIVFGCFLTKMFRGN